MEEHVLSEKRNPVLLHLHVVPTAVKIIDAKREVGGMGGGFPVL